MFRIGRRGPELAGTVPSRGVAPTSIDEDRGRVYVLNSGGTPSVSAFWRRSDGSLTPIPGGTRALAPGAAGAAQVSVTPDHRSLVVSELSVQTPDLDDVFLTLTGDQDQAQVAVR